MIFETLSLEYFLAGKTLPWNKPASPVAYMDDNPANLLMVKADLSKAKSQYFNLKG